MERFFAEAGRAEAGYFHLAWWGQHHPESRRGIVSYRPSGGNDEYAGLERCMATCRGKTR